MCLSWAWGLDIGVPLLESWHLPLAESPDQVVDSAQL